VETLPLVSVIVRSMDRTMLQDALGSVALQTYANVEVVVVNATGNPHSALGD
jgi:glycosyltransferase involved in cell wall biosynthesis